jgi:ferritin-like metal-binding protein YciE
MLNENPTGKKCPGMQGLLDEGKEVIRQAGSAAVKDAHLIIAAQKVEHYEIAAYGSARAIARHLSDIEYNDRVDFDEIADLLQESLDEEANADEKLTEIAEGSFFTTGINEEAEREEESRNQ